MIITRQILQFFIDLANARMGVDFDNAYVYQCVDVPGYAVLKWLGIHLWGNAIDLLDSAAANGLRVVYAGQEAIRPGAFFVMDYWAGGLNYGHTGLVSGIIWPLGRWMRRAVALTCGEKLNNATKPLRETWAVFCLTKERRS